MVLLVHGLSEHVLHIEHSFSKWLSNTLEFKDIDSFLENESEAKILLNTVFIAYQPLFLVHLSVYVYLQGVRTMLFF